MSTPDKKISQNKIEQQIRKAEELIEICDYPDAEIILNQVLGKDVENVEAHYLLGEVLSKMDNFNLAIEYLRKALLLFPRHPRILHLLGWVTFMNGDPDSGREFMLLSLEKLPELQTYCDLAVLENGQGNSEKAMEYAVAAKEIEPDNKKLPYWVDIDEHNKREVEERKNLSYNQVYNNFIKKSEEFINEYSHLSEELKDKLIWPDKKYTLLRFLKTNIHHYRHHLEKIRRI